MMSYLNVDQYVRREGKVEPQPDGRVGFFGFEYIDIDTDTYDGSMKAAAAALIFLGKKVGLKLVNMVEDE